MRNIDGAPRAFADALRHLVAIELGQPDIEQHHVREEPFRCRDRGLAIVRGTGLMAHDREHHREAQRRVVIVVHDQDPETARWLL